METSDIEALINGFLILFILAGIFFGISFLIKKDNKRQERERYQTWCTDKTDENWIGETGEDWIVETGEDWIGETDEDFTEKEQSTRHIPSRVRREVWRRDQGKCLNCGSQRRLEYDHIIPVSKGGSNTVRNIQLLCEECNRTKSDNIE